VAITGSNCAGTFGWVVDGWRRSVEVCGDQPRHRVPGKRRAAGQALIEHTRQRIDVGAGILLGSGAQPLRCDVLERADRIARLGQPRFIRSPGDPEIDQVSEVVAIEQDVGRFDVAVHQPDLVGGVQCLGDPLDDAHRPRGLQRPGGQHLL